MEPSDSSVAQTSVSDIPSQEMFSSEEQGTVEDSTEMTEEETSQVQDVELSAEETAEMLSAYLEPQPESMEIEHMTETEGSEEQSGDKENTETRAEEDDVEEQAREEVKICPFPISKLKRIMKTAIEEDTEVTMFNKEAVTLIGQATELFVAALAQEASKVTQLSKKKTITFQHLSACVKETDTFSFLEGALLPDFDL